MYAYVRRYQHTNLEHPEKNTQRFHHSIFENMTEPFRQNRSCTSFQQDQGVAYPAGTLRIHYPLDLDTVMVSRENREINALDSKIAGASIIPVVFFCSDPPPSSQKGVIFFSSSSLGIQTTLKKHVVVVYWVVYPYAPCMEYFTYIYHTFKPNVGKYAIHGSSIISRSNMDFTLNRIKALAPFKISVFFW